MAHGLDSLIRLERWRLDERRRLLARLVGRADDLRAQAMRLEREIADEQDRARDDPLGAGIAYPAYARAVIDRRARLSAVIAAAETEVAAARDDLALAFRQLKALEAAAAERARQASLRAARRDQAARDEIALQRHRYRSYSESRVR
ncbi:MAG: flagellar FliJ family protein [Rhodospirillales bacterium]